MIQMVCAEHATLNASNFGVILSYSHVGVERKRRYRRRGGDSMAFLFKPPWSILSSFAPQTRNGLVAMVILISKVSCAPGACDFGVSYYF